MGYNNNNDMNDNAFSSSLSSKGEMEYLIKEYYYQITRRNRNQEIVGKLSIDDLLYQLNTYNIYYPPNSTRKQLERLLLSTIKYDNMYDIDNDYDNNNNNNDDINNNNNNNN